MARASVQIVTPNYAARALAAAYLLRQNSPTVDVIVYITDGPDVELSLAARMMVPNIRFIKISELGSSNDLINKCSNADLSQERQVYPNIQPLDLVRWGLKPSAILAQLRSYDKVFYHDPDIVFVNDCSFLWDLLSDYGVLLSPHWSHPGPRGCVQLLRDGLYNAGFVGSSKMGSAALGLWQQLCHWKMSATQPFFVDQKYLSILPIYFPDAVKLVLHKGCNVAPWNLTITEPRLLNGKLVVSSGEPLVFVHNVGDFLNNRSELTPALLEVSNRWNTVLERAKMCLSHLSL